MRANPEALLQMRIKEYLGWCLPRSVLWTASMTGVNLSIRAATKAKAMGVRRGFPDLCFVLPTGETKWIELKTPTGSLSAEQREFRDHCQASGQDCWALARSLDDVEAALRRWGVSMKAHPFSAMTWEEAASP